jgi:hypothetical protein
MADVTPRQERIAQVERQQAEAALLLAAATHETVHAQIRRSTRNLEEALVRLNEPDVNSKVSTLKIVDLLIDIAAARLALVNFYLKTYGTGAEILG